MGANDHGEFLPTTYEAPKQNGGSYMKFQEGPNRFRILSSPIIGWLYWDKSENGTGKPVRLAYTQENQRVAYDKAKLNVDPKDQKAKHFWAMKVWNYATKEIEILEITQRGIQDDLRSISQNEDWGSPVGRYDLTVEKTGKGTDTTYSVTPHPHKPNSEEIDKADKEKFVNLDALFAGEDPFSAPEIPF